MTSGKFLILTFIVLLIQLFVAEFINLSTLLYIVITPLPILMLPYNFNNSLIMVIAFAIGLLTDLSYDGVMGLNAAALVAVAFFRKPVVKLVVSKTTRENLTEINSHTLGRSSLTVILLLLYSLFFLFYIALDNVLYFSFVYTLARFIINVIVNTFIIMILEFAILRNYTARRIVD